MAPRSLAAWLPPAGGPFVVVVVVVGSLVLGSALLLPAIIVGFGVTAAEREDRG